MEISANFDGGNIEVLVANEAKDIQLQIKKDANADFMQWFYFRLSGAKGQACKLSLCNVNEATYLEGWQNYQATASYDRENWFRVSTHYTGEKLVIEVTPEHDVIYFAYFAPYSLERHHDLIAQCQLSTACQVTDIGKTVEGREISLLTICKPEKHKRHCWIIARQHPGETMAEWFMEGFIDRLLDEHDPLSRTLLEQCIFYCVPNMNPDGSFHGFLRTNTSGANLNREWSEPTLTRSPEVLAVREMMQKTGVDFFLDVHGDEGLPYVFLAGCEGNPAYNSRLQSLEQNFKQQFLSASPDFQVEKGYPTSKPGEGNLSMATNYIGETFDCLAFTLEMPFKDNANLPDPEYGWSPERSRLLGRAVLHPILKVVPGLR